MTETRVRMFTNGELSTRDILSTISIQGAIIMIYKNKMQPHDIREFFDDNTGEHILSMVMDGELRTQFNPNYRS